MTQEVKAKLKNTKPFYCRKIGKGGGTRTLSVGKVLPTDWQHVKVSVERLEGKICILRVERLI